ncbi:hypothetical protein [Bacillus sp. Marseille-P3661]|uniref:hypothetical protein n=1 Tax=Bacillus sp. Marseille-P3661 TaxID=1936234 RepID=UPI000C854DEB|nr:hypothetical protein [Bacillus sp. Marseille-P3661]
MFLVIAFSLITIISIVFALRKQKAILLGVPFASIAIYMLIKIIMVPLPFIDTVRFIMGLR